MLLISLMLAAAPPPATRPETVVRRKAARVSEAAGAARSKRLIELEAAVASLPLTDPDPGREQGPRGL